MLASGTMSADELMGVATALYPPWPDGARGQGRGASGLDADRNLYRGAHVRRLARVFRARRIGRL